MDRVRDVFRGGWDDAGAGAGGGSAAAAGRDIGRVGVRWDCGAGGAGAVADGFGVAGGGFSGGHRARGTVFVVFLSHSAARG